MKKLFVVILAGTVHFLSWGQSNVFPTPSGNVSIGAGTNPQAPLHILNNANIQSILLESNSTGWGSGMVFKNTAANGKIYGIYAGSYGAFQISDNNLGVNRLLISSNGNIGVGTDAPATKLHVSGGHIAASIDDNLGGFVQLWDDNAIIWKNGNSNAGLRFGSATNLNAASWSEKMRITDAGNIGIGTTTPNDKLEVAGNIRIYTGNTDGGRLIWYGGTNGTQEYRARVAPDGHLAFFPGEGIPTTLSLTQNGRVGIGTTTPSNPLTVVTTAEEVAQFKNTSTNNTRIFVANNTGQINVGIGSTNPHAYLWSSTGKLFIGEDGSNPTMFIDGMYNGNVGIGTTDTKGYKLAVNGSAIFTKVVVKLYANWGDYVFEKDYHLPSLQEIEQFIQTHKHLPEMPSAAEVEKNGLDLGDNQALVVKKIEELTLYIIDQQKQIDELKQELEKIKKKRK